jgi:hypothetical protein
MRECDMCRVSGHFPGVQINSGRGEVAHAYTGPLAKADLASVAKPYYLVDFSVLFFRVRVST